MALRDSKEDDGRMCEGAINGVSGTAEDKNKEVDSVISLGKMCTIVDEPKTVEANNNKRENENLCAVVESFLRHLRKEFEDAIAVDQLEGYDEDLLDTEKVQMITTENDVEVLAALCHFIGEPDTLLMNKAILRKAMLGMEQHFDTEIGQTDVEDYLDNKPTEILAIKAIQVFCALALPQPAMFLKEMKQFKRLINDPRIAQDSNAQAAYDFIYKSMEGMFGVLLPANLKRRYTNTGDLTFKNLSTPSQAIVGAVSVIFLKQFKLNAVERLFKLRKIVKKDESNFELSLYLADHLRMKRREVTSREKFPSNEEMTVLANAYSIAPENPFVILTVLDTLIGVIRDSSGRFFLGSLSLNTVEDSIRYLQDTCAKLALKYPKNVLINSVVSDYFARFVPLRYFDIDFSLKTLMAAYETNPRIAKTTHRLGILYRMSLGKLDESLEWFAKTIQLDPYHHAATMEYFKSLLGKGDKVDVLSVMLQKVDSPVSEGWNCYERAEVYFYLGIAHFIKSEYEGTWKWWKDALTLCETPFNLVDLSETFIHYMKDKSVISIDQLRLWVHKEVQRLASKQTLGEPFDAERNALAQRIFQLMIGIGPKPGKNIMKNFPYTNAFPKECLKNLVHVD